MVAINFKPGFALAVAMGEKTQTIRQTARCKPGDELQLYTGQRTKDCQKLRDATCIDVQPVTIANDVMTVGQTTLGPVNADVFANSDGFDDYPEMTRFFDKLYGLPFNGYVIEWE